MRPVRVLIAGSGGREHALAWSCMRHRARVQVACAPGNPGTEMLGDNLAIKADDPGGIARAADAWGADLVVVGPDAALAAGVADACRARGLAVFGPSAAAARIESSKVFAKRLMDAAGIPTARWCAGSAADRGQLLSFIADLGGRCAVKADGLALGKGVTVCDDVDTAVAAVRECLDEARFGRAGQTVVIDERLEGEEVSVFALSDGRNVRLLPPARDHKRLGDGDTGPNTGGMGAVTPPPGLAVDRLLDEAERTVIRPCIDALAEGGTPFVGCLYAGLMLTAAGIRVIEFNARFGDPEAQVLLPVLGEDLCDLMNACARGGLEPGRVSSRKEHAAVGVVLAAAGYPGIPRRGDAITGVEALGPGVMAFHAGTRRDQGTLRTDGGRVLTIVAAAGDLDEARRRAYRGAETVQFRGVHYRTDIAAREVTRP